MNNPLNCLPRELCELNTTNPQTQTIV